MTGESILAVDDTAPSLKLVRDVLESEGYDVRTARDAFAALRILERFHPRVVLVDVRLPGMSGLELARRIKSNPRTQDILVLATSADPDLLRETPGSGCDGFLSKPFEVEELARWIAGLVDRTGADRGVGTSPPRLDFSGELCKIASRLGRKAFANLLDQYVASAEDDLDEIRRSLGAKDPARLAGAAHRLGGSSALFGAREVRSVCTKLEHFGKLGKLEPATMLLVELASALQLARSIIETWRHEEERPR